MDNVLIVKKYMRAFDNLKGETCEMCHTVPDTLYQFWYLLPDEAPLSRAVERALPAFCGHECWRQFINGKQFSDRADVRVTAGGER
jgi:hypothetical protein